VIDSPITVSLHFFDVGPGSLPCEPAHLGTLRRLAALSPRCAGRISTKEGHVMKLRTLVLASAVFAAGSGLAFAQSSPAPANQSGGGVSATTPSPTDPSSAAESGNTKGTPARGTMNAQPRTTGSGMSSPTPSSSSKESQEKNASPASPAEGTEKVK